MKADRRVMATNMMSERMSCSIIVVVKEIILHVPIPSTTISNGLAFGWCVSQVSTYVQLRLLISPLPCSRIGSGLERDWDRIGTGNRDWESKRN